MTTGADPVASAIRSTRVVVGSLVGGAIGWAVVVSQLPANPSLSVLQLPAVLSGALAPVLGFRLYSRSAEELAAGESTLPAYARATILALAVTEVGAFLAGLAWWGTGDPLSWIGLATHVLLAGALWPGESRYEAFVAAGAGRGRDD